MEMLWADLSRDEAELEADLEVQAEKWFKKFSGMTHHLMNASLKKIIIASFTGGHFVQLRLMPRSSWKVLAIAVGFAIGQAISACASMQPVDLRCDYMVNPMGLDSNPPRLFWKLAADAQGQRQTAYQILVASSLKNLAANQGDQWDSGKVSGDETIQIAAGKSLASDTDYFWKVRSWDSADQPGRWSESAQWTTGLLQPNDWRAAWICADLPDEVSPWLRRTFTLGTQPTRAVAYVNAIGYFELYVNGRKVGSDVLSPAVTDTRVHSLYVAYDIAPYLKRGSNCIGLWCGRGWSTRADPPGQRIRFQCRIATGANQEPVWITSDDSWKSAPSPYQTLGKQSWGNFGGEGYDANRENPKWCAADFDDSSWANAKLAPTNPARAEAQSCPLNRAGKMFPATGCTPLAESRYEIDFGSNLSGQLQLKLSGLKTNQVVRIFYADHKSKPNVKVAEPAKANVIFRGLSGAVTYQTFAQMDEFISAGRANELFSSKFNYHGFRYAIVEGLAHAPQLSDAQATLIESDLESVGSFECSNELLNRIHGLTLWTVRCLNLGGYMVDCPHRERMGYGDGQISFDSQAYNLWTPAFYQKWIGDWRITQKPKTADISHTAPDWGGGGGPAWGGSFATLIWKMYEYYGDRQILAENYEAMRRYVDYLESRCQENVLRSYGGKWAFIGDWVAPGRGMDTTNWPAKPAAELFNNCYRIHLWEILEQSAAALGNTAEVARCQAALATKRPAIHEAFFDKTNGVYVLNEQVDQVMPLLFGVVPPEQRPAVLAKLVDNIQNRSQSHLDTGMLGTYFLIQYLHQIGRDDLLFAIINQKTYPSWGYMLANDATTVWEQWNGYYSQIHSCFASPGGWFYQSLAGIQPDPAGPGFKRIIIKPTLVGDVTWVKAHYDSIHGRIVSNWRLQGNRLTLNVSIPANTMATVFVPAKSSATVKTDGGRFLRMENGNAVFAIESGNYTINSTL